ncbi:MAG: iron-only hydrogenase system regulator [Lachnospiraceae bacterium]|nr:iron-only hydrogenase system regulator [Lachnospiraceae bacterium]
MDTRIALIGIIVENNDSIEQLNQLLGEYSQYIIGRMGVPYREKQISIISVTLDAPGDCISALSGKLGMLPGISSKTLYAKNEYQRKT